MGRHYFEPRNLLKRISEKYIMKMWTGFRRFKAGSDCKLLWWW